MALIYLLCFLLLSTIRAAEPPAQSPSPAPKKLLFVAELCRHGDRAPLHEYPADAFPVSKWPEGQGQLTAIGQRAHFELGQRMRKRYVDTGFLPESFSVKDIYIRSTDVDRTLVSAASQMAGFYPPGTAPNYDVRVRFGKDPLGKTEGGLPFLYQPVPIHSTSSESEMMLSAGGNCPRHDYIMQRKEQQPEYKQRVQYESNFIREVAKIVKKDPKHFTIADVERVSDTWTCFAAHSVPLPPGATPAIISHARNISNWLLLYGNQDAEVNRLRAGLILHTINHYMAMAAVQNGKHLPHHLKEEHKKFVLLSAHDTNIAATLAAMQVFDGVYPPYNSTIIWELYMADDNSFFVKVEYNGKPLLLPHCSNQLCPVKEYLRSTAERTVYGQVAREIECLVGFSRYSAMAGNLFSTKRRAEHMEDLEIFVDGEGPKDRFSALATVLMSFAVVVGAVAILRRFSRHPGYVTANNQSPDSQPVHSMAEAVSDRQHILM